MKITTANDNSIYRGRNPRVFALYGSNQSSRPYANDRSWELVAYNNGDTLLEDVNYKTYEYKMQGEFKRYKYYKIEITETKGASVMQMSELSLISGKYDFIPSNVSSASGSLNSPYSDYGSSSYSNSNNSSVEFRCSKCHGTGTVTCSACDGRGGRDVLNAAEAAPWNALNVVVEVIRYDDRKFSVTNMYTYQNMCTVWRC